MKAIREYIAEDIDTRLQYHESLNPKLWDGHKLRLDVKQALAKIASAFVDFIDIEGLQVSDVIITGSNCAFNYTPQSDIDIHVLVDVSAIGDKELVDSFLYAEKQLWNSTHDITVKGYSVELYAEDAEDQDTLVATGIYSLVKDEWLRKPTYEPVTVDDAAVIVKAEDLMGQIDYIIDSGDIESADKIWDKIRKMRQAGLEDKGEASVENLTFKVLRNHDYLTKLRTFQRQYQDRSLSLESRQNS